MTQAKGSGRLPTEYAVPSVALFTWTVPAYDGAGVRLFRAIGTSELQAKGYVLAHLTAAMANGTAGMGTASYYYDHVQESIATCTPVQLAAYVGEELV